MDLSCAKYGLAENFCEHGNEILCPMRGGERLLAIQEGL
jgi:hypothetical protein